MKSNYSDNQAPPPLAAEPATRKPLGDLAIILTAAMAVLLVGLSLVRDNEAIAARAARHEFDRSVRAAQRLPHEVRMRAWMDARARLQGCECEGYERDVLVHEIEFWNAAVDSPLHSIQ